MKVINKTKKYLHVRMSADEFVLFDQSLKKAAFEKRKEKEQQEYAEWFFTNHVEISWEDEYGSSHSYWRSIKTGRVVQDPGLYVTMYRGYFTRVIKDNKKKYCL